MRYPFDERILDIKNKIGNLLVLLSSLERYENENPYITHKELKKYFSQSKINNGKIQNSLIDTFINGEEAFHIGEIVNILEEDFLHFNKYEKEE